ncbi:hypothetical protein LINPERHAP2_LOCUS35419, partial [Linum perenne]
WSSAWVKQHYTAGMVTTQLVESCNEIWHGNERLDDRVVKVEPGDGIVSCDCRWWDTIAILCRHSLTVMHILAIFGNEKFKTLDQRYIKKRWTRSAKRSLVSLIIPRPITRGEEEEQRYTRIFAKFGFIIRAALPIFEVSEMVDAAGDALAEKVEQALALYEAPRVGVNTGLAGSEQTPPPQSRIEKTVATKFPKQSKPSKNSKRWKGIVKLSRMKERNKFKRKRAKEAVIEAAVEASRLQDNLAAIFDNSETVTSFPSFTELLQSQESVNRRLYCYALFQKPYFVGGASLQAITVLSAML